MRKQLYLIAIILSGLFALNSCTVSEFEKRYAGGWHLVFIDSEFGGMESLFYGNSSIWFSKDGSFKTPYYDVEYDDLCYACDGDWKVVDESIDGNQATVVIDVADALFKGEWEIEMSEINTGQPRIRMTMKKKGTNTIVVAEAFKQ